MADINWGSSTQAHVYRSALVHSMKLMTVNEHVKNFRSVVSTSYVFSFEKTDTVLVTRVTKGSNYSMLTTVPYR